MTNLFSYYTQVLFLVFIVVNHLVEIYLIRRQLRAYQQQSMTPPSEFSEYISDADHQKAIQYSTSKLNLSQLRLIFDAGLLFYWFPFRGAEKLYLSVPGVDIHKEVFFLLAFGLVQLILSLPWSIYSTFVLEEKYGFNKSTPKLFIMDRLKALALSTIIGTPLLYTLIFFYQALPQWWWLVSFLVITLFQFFLVWIYPTVIAPLFNKFHPLEGEELKNGIENLVKRAGFNAREVFVMDASRRSSHGNAYFTGFGKNKRVVFFDTLLKQLNTQEILAILAHELGHMKLKHIPKSIVTSIVLSFVGFYVMGKLADEAWFYQGHFLKIISPGALLLLFTQAIPLYTFWFSPVSSWVSRRREFEADEFAAGETDAQHLIDGLLKLYQQNASPVVTDSWFSGFYHSHPPALNRVQRLKSLKRQTSE
jgi:STE24 endopeptidase